MHITQNQLTSHTQIKIVFAQNCCIKFIKTSKCSTSTILSALSSISSSIISSSTQW